MQRRVKGSWALTAAVLAAVAGAGAARAEQPGRQYFYTYQHRPMPLGLHTDRIAVFRDSSVEAADAQARGIAALPSVGVALAPWGVNEEDVTKSVIRDWSHVTVPAGRQSDEGIHTLVTQAAAAGEFDFVSPVFFDEYGPVTITRDLLIGFDRALSHEEIDQLIANTGAGAVLDRDFQGMPNVYRVRSDSRSGYDVLDKANELSGRPEVLYAEPDMLMTTQKYLTPNDPSFTSLWGLHNTGQSGGTVNMDMDGPEAWDVTTGSSGIKVVVIDDGVQLTHPDLNLTTGMDFTGNGTNGDHFNSCDEHGTWVAGCISAKINNSIGVVGICPDCRVAPAKFSVSNVPCDGSGSFQISWFTGAVNWAQTIGAKVTNCSNGFGANGSVDTAYTNTYNAGVAHFASTGNSGGNTIGYPASSPSVNAVGAVSRSGNRASFSQYGTGIDFSAPGQSIVSTQKGSTYGTVDGTSFSSPYAAGVAAIVFAKNQFLTPAQVEGYMQQSCLDRGTAGYDTTYGWGIVKARGALDLAPAVAPPQPFNLTTPANGAIDVSRYPTFAWQTATNAQSYHLEVDNNSDFSSPEIDVTQGGTDYTVTGTPLPVATTFFWRVTASNFLGDQVSTPTSSSFETLSHVPGSFSLSAPSNGATSVPLIPTYSWTAAPLAESYTVTVDDNSDFSSPVASFNTALTSTGHPGSLSPLTTYYWKVTANNPIGSTASSPVSRQFETIGQLPGSFNLLAPADGSNVATLTPTLQWSASGGATSYTLILDDSPTLTTPILTQTGIPGTSFAIPGGLLSNGGFYIWTIQAVNSFGNTTSSPPQTSFSIVVPICQGDANGDYVVNFADITAVLANFGGGGPIGDANHDHAVNFVDVTSVLASYGANCPH